MATIKAIEGRSVHQIQSGQVIVDLCSVVKELVENGLDAGATVLDVRFKSSGLEAIEVQDNGAGIPKDDYASLALKHYTSKLSTYDDLSTLNTFGFRGEALSSLCALSTLIVTTARQSEAPKGSKLEFETSGKLKSSSVAACPTGTTVSVGDLFNKLPVRKRELEKNIKREYNKAVTLLNAYACVCTNVKFSVSNQPTKGKRISVFSTRGNETTRDNIANVFGAKSINALTPLDLSLELEATRPTPALLEVHGAQALRNGKVEIHGHVSRPVHGEGRHLPDRQMFFVNSRPCLLPQIAKAFNEIYKSYNITQSPFVFANLIMDTNAYDVNVSPDKRTIMLHDQQHLLSTLKDSLVELFEAQEQTVPLTQASNLKNKPFKPPTLIKESSSAIAVATPNSPDQGRSPSEELSISNTIETAESPAPVGTQIPPWTQLDERRNSSRLSARPRRSPSEQTSRERVQYIADAKAKIVQDFNASIGNGTTAGSAGKDRSPPVSDARDTAYSPMFIESEAPSPAAEQQETEQEIKRSDSAGEQQHNVEAHPVAQLTTDTNSRKRKRNHANGESSSKARASKSSQITSFIRGFAAEGTDSSTTQLGAQEIVSDVEEADDDDDEEPEDAELHDAEGAGTYAQMAQTAQDEPDWQSLAQGRSSPSPNNEDDDDNVMNDEHHDDHELRIDDKDNQSHEHHVHESDEEADERAAPVYPGRPNRKLAREIMQSSSSQLHNVLRPCSVSVADIGNLAHELRQAAQDTRHSKVTEETEDALSSNVTPEERLSLTITKSDFPRMRIVGQFNLGFILAVRPGETKSTELQDPLAAPSRLSQSDDLFIIDQHASDEIYNFHRLSATTELTPQPLVRPQQLELTAIEEETVITHKDHSLFKNGFRIDVDESGDTPVGERCKLTTLPTSKETVFTTADLEELLVLLQDAPSPRTDGPNSSSNDPLHSLTASSKSIVRPAKVRRMLAMRACRSSIMVGRALTNKQMGAVLRHMGEMTRPWNCPHGRPTMRHLSGLDTLNTWCEGTENSWAHQEDMFELEEEREWDGGKVDWIDFLGRVAHD